MISIYTWFFTAVSFRNMTDHLVYISDISPQTIRQSTSVLPQTALLSPVCFHCVLSTAMCLRPPCPLSPTQAACVACVLDSCPRPIQSTGTRAPCVFCFSHSSALTSAQFQEGRWNDCVREEAPLTSAVWLAYPGLVEAPTIPAKAPTTMQSKGCFTYHMLFCSRS